MEWLRDWIRNLILIILLAHFIELLLPANDLKKYVKVVIGFFIMMAILAPILQLTGRDLAGLEVEVFPAEAPSFDEIVARGEQLRESQAETVQGEFSEQLSQKITAVVNLNAKLQAVTTKVELTDNNRINKIVITGKKRLESDAAEAELEKLARQLEATVAVLYNLEQAKVEVVLEEAG